MGKLLLVHEGEWDDDARVWVAEGESNWVGGCDDVEDGEEGNDCVDSTAGETVTVRVGPVIISWPGGTYNALSNAYA